MINDYYYEYQYVNYMDFTQLETKIFLLKKSLITMGFNLPPYQSELFNYNSYLLAKYLIKIEDALKEIADIKGTDIETREWNINGKDSFSYKDLNRWIKAYNLAYEELGQHYLATFTNFTTIENIKSKKLINLQLYGNTSQNGTPTPTTPVNVEVVTGKQIVNECRKNIFDKSQSAIIRVSSSYSELDTGVRATLTATGTNKFIGIRIGGSELLGKTLTVSSTITASGTNTGRIRFYFISGTSTKGMISDSSLTSTGSKTFTIPNEFDTASSDGIAILLDSNRNGANASVGDYVDYTNLQIEISNQATEYEQYSGKDYEIDLGKNLIYNNVHTTEETFNQVKYTPNSDGSISVSGTANGDYNYYILGSSNNYPLILQPGTYTLSGSISNNAWVRLYDGTTYYDATTNLAKTFTITQTTRLNVRLRVKNGTTVNDTFYPMLEKGSTATAYRKHKEPIELCKIDTYQDRIFKSSGKNLFDNTYGTTNDKYTTSISAGSPLGNLSCYEMQLKPSTTYTLTVDMNGYAKANTWVAGICFADGTPISLLQYGNMSNVTTATFTTDSTGKIYVGHRYGFSNANRMPLFLQTALVQIEENNSSTIYEPYGTDWYIEKQIGKVVLNGSEYWNKLNYAFQTGADTTPNKGAVYINAYSNYYKHKYYESGITSNIQNGEFGWNSGKNLTIRNDNCSTADDFKTWLNGHNTTIYYVLLTPTYTKIEDTELINTLENIETIKPLMNIIYSTSNLQPSAITFEYFK